MNRKFFRISGLFLVILSLLAMMLPTVAVEAAAPSITTVSPNTGPNCGGINVTITGTSLAAATSVTFGGVAAPMPLVSNTSTKIVATLPASAATGSVNVVVVNSTGTGTKTSGFAYTPATSVNLSLNPSYVGPIAVGDPIDVTVVAEGNSCMDGIDIELAYDPAKIAYDSADSYNTNGFNAELVAPGEVEPGLFRYVTGRLSPPYSYASPSLNIITLHFYAQAGGMAQISFVRTGLVPTDISYNNVKILGLTAGTDVEIIGAAAQYSVTYDGNGNTGGTAPVDSNLYDEGSSVQVLPPGDLVKAGYAFTGWKDQNGTAYDVDSFFDIFFDVTLSAQWAPVNYTVIFDANGGTGSMAPQTSNLPAPLALNGFAREGYDFGGWSLSPDGPVAYADGAEYAFDADATLYAQWIVKLYTISFNSNGGTAVAPITQAFGSVVVPPANPTRAGFIFNAWVPAVPNPMPAHDTTCLATWTQVWTVSFDTAGGVPAAIDPITAPEGTTIVAPPAPTKEGFNFMGWVPEVPSVMPAENTLCVAQWEAAVVYGTIHFDGNGGTPAMTDITLAVGSAVTPPTVTRSGYTFAGWLPVAPATMPEGEMTCVAQWNVVIPAPTITTIVPSSGSTAGGGPPIQINGTNLNGTTSVTFGGTPGTSITVVSNTQVTVVVPAHAAGKVDVVVTTPGGSATKVQGYEYKAPPPPPTITSITPNHGPMAGGTNVTIQGGGLGGPVATSITFNGVAATNIVQDPGVPGSIPAFYKCTTPASLTSGFATVKLTNSAGTATSTDKYSYDAPLYTITFDSAGGSAVAPITQAAGTPVTAPADPTKDGYTFAGWSPAVPATMPAGDMTCVAQWEKIIIISKITFDSQGGSAVDPIIGEAGSPVTAPADPTRDGYIFLGWYPAVPNTMPEQDMTCVAQWANAPIPEMPAGVLFGAGIVGIAMFIMLRRMKAANSTIN